MSPLQVEQLVAEILPGIPAETVTPLVLIDALVGPQLSFEAEGGWLARQITEWRRGADGIRKEIHHFKDFINFLDLRLNTWRLDDQRHKIHVGEMSHFIR